VRSILTFLAALGFVGLLLFVLGGKGPMPVICEHRLQPTEVRVTTTPVEFTTDLSVPTSRLTEMASTGSGRLVHGLTRTNMRSLVTVGSSGITNPLTGRHCLRPIVDVRLAFEPMTVFITADQQPGSCQFDVTMKHELQHVEVYRTFLDTAARDVEKYLAGHFGNRIYYFDSADDAQKQMSDETSKRIGPFVEEEMNRVRELQAPLDTPDEYLRLERSCFRSSGPPSP
jgi:hypothetical protein